MKKILAIILVLCTFVCCLTSCDKNENTDTYKKNTWYTANMLDLCLVSDLPEISGTDYLKANDETVFAKMSDEQFEAYVGEIFEYLKQQEFEYFGTRGDWYNNFLHYYVYNFKKVDTLDECILDEANDSLTALTYIFVYSDGTADENGNIIFNIIKIEKFKKESTVKYTDDVFKCTMKITIYHESEPVVSYKI